MLKFFNKEEQSNSDNDLINVACLMIHAAKIDEHYTDKEKTIIKNTINYIFLPPNLKSKNFSWQKNSTKFILIEIRVFDI